MSDPAATPAPYVGEKHRIGLTRMMDGSYRSAVAVYAEDGMTELLRVPYDDAAKVLLTAFAAKRPE